LDFNFQLTTLGDPEKQKLKIPEKRKTEDTEQIKDLKKVRKNMKLRIYRNLITTIQFIYIIKAKLETKALKAKRPGFTDERYQETSYYTENGNEIK